MPAEPYELPIVDSHVHWWDPSNSWMRMATQEEADGLRMGDVSGMIRSFLPADYRRETVGHDVRKVVWVMATMDPGGLTAEVDWVLEVAGGDALLAALIGSVDPALSARDRRAALARQARDPRFRGVRVLGGLDYGSRAADEYMEMLAEGGYIYEFIGHHESMAHAAGLAERHPDVTWVVEHCGWPLHPDDAAYVASWRAGIEHLAALPNVHCKISGLAMSVHSFAAAPQRPFAEACLDAFGPARCLFASNFPVDALYGSYDELIRMYADLTAALDPAQRAAFFSGNAERLYGI